MPPANRSQARKIIDAESDVRAIRDILGTHHDWFVSLDGRSPLDLNTDEFDLSVAHGRLLFSSWTETGSRTWRISAWSSSGEKLLLHASRRFGAENVNLELVPRASAQALVASITAARRERCDKLARIVGDYLAARVEKATLSPGMRRDQPGRYARIILRLPHERIALTGTVAQTDVRNVDALFSSALLWFERIMQSPKRPHIQRLLLSVEHSILDAARQRHVLLRDSLRERIELLEIDDDWTSVTQISRFERKHLWRKRLMHFPSVNEAAPAEGASAIAARAPEAIDIVASRHGHTLRFHGLPFARTRRVMDCDRTWFGIEGSRRRQLNDFHERDWAKLLQDLEI